MEKKGKRVREEGRRETTLLSRRCVARMATQTQGVAQKSLDPMCLSLVPVGTRTLTPTIGTIHGPRLSARVTSCERVSRGGITTSKT